MVYHHGTLQNNSVHTIIKTDSIVMLGVLIVDSKLLLLEVIKQLFTQSTFYAKHEYLSSSYVKRRGR